MANPLAFTPPMLAKLVRTLPEGPDWEYELKLDGYRLQAIKHADKVRLYSRRGNDFTRKFAKIATNVSKIKATSLMGGVPSEPSGGGRNGWSGTVSQNTARVFNGNLNAPSSQIARIIHQAGQRLPTAISPNGGWTLLAHDSLAQGEALANIASNPKAFVDSQIDKAVETIQSRIFLNDELPELLKNMDAGKVKSIQIDF